MTDSTADLRRKLEAATRLCANPLGIYDEDGYCHWCGNHKGKAGHGYDCPLADALDPTLTPRSPLPHGGDDQCL